MIKKSAFRRRLLRSKTKDRKRKNERRKDQTTKQKQIILKEISFITHIRDIITKETIEQTTMIGVIPTGKVTNIIRSDIVKIIIVC